MVNNPLKPTTPGRCRYCRCTYDHACDEGCAWLDRQQTVCDSPSCMYSFIHAVLKVLSGVAKLAGVTHEQKLRRRA